MTKSRTPHQHQQGFSLIELLTVIAIIGILTGIALPMYSDYVTRSRLSEPISELSSARVRMEQFFQDNRTYVGACTTGTVAPKPVNSTYFSYTCPTLTASTYEIVAQGIGTMAGFEYRINQDNAHTTTALPSGWVNTGTCWVIKKSGAC